MSLYLAPSLRLGRSGGSYTPPDPGPGGSGTGYPAEPGSGTAPDTIPDAISFTPVTGATQSTWYEAGEQTLTGTDANTTISTTGGEYALGAGSSTWTAVAGTIPPAGVFNFRVMSSASYATGTSGTLDIGGVTADLDVTTGSAPGGTARLWENGTTRNLEDGTQRNME